MNYWKNLDTLHSFQKMKKENRRVDLREELAGEKGAARVAAYQVPMAAGLVYSYAAKQVDDTVLAQLIALADESCLAEKF